MATKRLKSFEEGHGFTRQEWDEVSDSPEVTAELLQNARPFAEAFPDLADSIRRARGKQKLPTKQLVSLRIDRDVLDAFKSSGSGWQKRINDSLRQATKLLKSTG
jgi:hypothetical protein